MDRRTHPAQRLRTDRAAAPKRRRVVSVRMHHPAPRHERCPMRRLTLLVTALPTMTTQLTIRQRPTSNTAGAVRRRSLRNAAAIAGAAAFHHARNV
jgi:hypothetical protein